MGKLEDKGRSPHASILSERDDCYLAQLVQTTYESIAFKYQMILQEVSNIISSLNIVNVKCQ